MLREANFELLRREAESAFAQGGTDGLVVVGGDGMVSLGVNLVAQTGVPLGIVAAGTGNDLARGPRPAVRRPGGRRPTPSSPRSRAQPRAIDAGVIRHGELRTWFACVVSTGFDAVVNERANRMTRPRGPSRYTLALVRELATFRPRTYTITIDGVRREQRAMLVSVANNASLGGGMRIVPHADLADGLLDVFIVHPLSRVGLLAVFPKVFAGEHVDHPAVEFVQARRVRDRGRRHRRVRRRRAHRPAPDRRRGRARRALRVRLTGRRMPRRPRFCGSPAPVSYSSSCRFGPIV